MKEAIIVQYIEKCLNYENRYYVNNHGSSFSKNGTPDFITMDKDHIFVGIEAKAPKKSPYPNQWLKCIEILKSGGRYIVAQDDFSLIDLDNKKIKTLEISSEIGESEFEKRRIIGTTEIILKK